MLVPGSESTQIIDVRHSAMENLTVIATKIMHIWFYASLNWLIVENGLLIVKGHKTATKE